MSGLLDYVFYNLEERDLDRSQIAAYIRYLDEILFQGLPPEKELAYQPIKLQLLKRLNELNQRADSILPERKAFIFLACLPPITLVLRRYLLQSTEGAPLMPVRCNRVNLSN